LILQRYRGGSWASWLLIAGISPKGMRQQPTPTA